jgi:hypothetical protein
MWESHRPPRLSLIVGRHEENPVTTPPRNRAHDFFDTHVVPAVEEWEKSPTDIRFAMSAAVALNQMADHYWHGFSPTDPTRVFGVANVKSFRAELAKRNDQWSLVRDVAEAHKHVKLSRPVRAVTSAGQALVAPTGFGVGGFGTGPFGGAPSVIILLDNGHQVHLSAAIKVAMEMWGAMLA